MGCANPLAHPISFLKWKNKMKMSGKIANDGFEAVSGDHFVTRHHKIPRIWVVLADRHIMRVFMKPDGKLEQIAEAHPGGEGIGMKAAGHDGGKIASSANMHIRHRLESGKTPDEKEEIKFVRDMAVWLDQAVEANSFDRLILAASPKMLGDLRKTLSDSVQSRIVAQIDKDLTKMQEKDLLEELQEIVWF